MNESQSKVLEATGSQSPVSKAQEPRFNDRLAFGRARNLLASRKGFYSGSDFRPLTDLEIELCEDIVALAELEQARAVDAAHRFAQYLLAHQAETA